MGNLQNAQDAVAAKLRDLAAEFPFEVVTIASGDVAKETAAAIARQNIVAIVGECSFVDETPDAALCHGTASIAVEIGERPAVNRAAPHCITGMELAQLVAKGLKLFDTGNGILVTKRIGETQFLDGGLTSVTVYFEFKTTLK